MEDCEAALTIDPRLPEAYGTRGQVRYARRDFDGAIADLRRALEIAPPGWPARATAEAMLREVESRR
jgi:tetratricopeptide (TPR) repeat protein